MVETYLTYTIVFLIAMFFAWRYQKSRFLNNQIQTNNGLIHNEISRVFAYLFVIGAPVFLGAVRLGVGKDFWNYENNFQILRNRNMIDALTESREPLFTLLNYIADIIFSGKVWGLFFLSSLITMLFIIIALDYYKKKISLPMALFIYFMLYYIESYNLVRQMIAVSIVFFAFHFILERKFLKYLITIIVAILFHQSAFICIFFYFLSFKNSSWSKLSKIFFYVIIFTTPFIMAPLVSLLPFIPIISFYVGRYSFSTGGFGLGFLIEVIPVVVPALLFRRKLIEENPNYEIFVNIALVSIPLRFIGYYQYWASRMVLYPGIIQILIVTLSLRLIKNKSNRFLAYFIFILFYIGLFIYEYVVNNRGPAYPYISFF